MNRLSWSSSVLLPGAPTTTTTTPLLQLSDMCLHAVSRAKIPVRITANKEALELQRHERREAEKGCSLYGFVKSTGTDI